MLPKAHSYVLSKVLDRLTEWTSSLLGTPMATLLAVVVLPKCLPTVSP